MTERTKIERVGGHLLIDDITAVAIHGMRMGSGYDAAGRDSLVINGVPTRDWTAREVLEAAYDSAPDEVSDLNATIDDLARAGLEMERAKNEEIAVLREALRRVLGHYLADARNDYGIDEDAWDDVAASMVLAKAEGPRFEEPAIERGLASIHEAAKVGR